MKKHVNGIGEKWGSEDLLSEKSWKSHPLEHWKKPFCKIGYELLSLLIFMLRSKFNPWHVFIEF